MFIGFRVFDEQTRLMFLHLGGKWSGGGMIDARISGEVRRVIHRRYHIHAYRFESCPGRSRSSILLAHRDLEKETVQTV